ncbi:MAG: hypothetical protein ACQEVA_17455 [Myxococcota bacterium]
MADDPSDNHIFPAPTIVLGVGRFGLAVLERIADDWESLSSATDDPSLKNLRLLHVRPEDDGTDPGWRKNERQFVEIARYTGDGDLPSLAVDMLLLRSLGLVRYRNGTYQVAVPRDAGYDTDEQDRAARLRFFTWHDLSPDPITAVERLRVQRERIPELDLFVAPLLNRVRQGHSPRTILAAISRCRAYAEGRDPAPWRWMSEAAKTQGATDPYGARRTLSFRPAWLNHSDLIASLDGLAPDPLEGWQGWMEGRRRSESLRGGLPSEMPAQARGSLDIKLPAVFIPTTRDLMAATEPSNLLRVDWETTGWATEEMNAGRDAEFRPVDVSDFRLGLFDHDGVSRVHQGRATDFRKRLRELAVHAHRGLVRMWVDLQRERVDTAEPEPVSGRWRDQVDESLRQSLEMLGELLVRPLLSEKALDTDADSTPTGRDDTRVDGEPLSLDATPNLERLVVDASSPDNTTRHALHERLEALGFAPDAKGADRRMLFRQLELRPEDIQTDGSQSSAVDSDSPSRQREGLLELRKTLNEKTRQLFDFHFLTEYRDRPVRRPPRLSIYVVGDVSEAFTRSTVRPILREIHAELLRAYGPIFETYREGFDRALSVVPILWMPHPSDAFGGAHPLENRCEEAAIIESVQGVRRWVESVPRGTRCIPQVFINSRVTDNSVLSVSDAIRQTRDFLNFQCRNDISSDPWLRRTATGASGEDFLASFACHEIEFPAERAREYLANRYSRASLDRLRSGDRVDTPEVDDETVETPDRTKLLTEPVQRLQQDIKKVADDIETHVETASSVDRDSTADGLAASFDRAFEDKLKRKIAHRWHALTENRGEMDEMMDALRREIAGELDETYEAIEKEGDRLIEEHASEGGLMAARAGFNHLHDVARKQLRSREGERVAAESDCVRHRIPEYGSMESARRSVVAESEQKPDWSAMKFGMLAWALMAPALGAPICWTLAKAFDLHLNPNWLEMALGPGAPILGAILVLIPVFWLLTRHMDQRVDAVRDAVRRLGEAARGVVDGGGPGLDGRPSVRSFFQSRLVHTAGLAIRNYALHVYQTVLEDQALVRRLARSVNLQREELLRRAEGLGVRTEMSDSTSTPGHDDVSNLFETRSRTPIDKLIAPESLVDYYETKIGGKRELDRMLPAFIDGTGGLDNWRKVACLSDTDAILRYGAGLFAELTNEPVTQQFGFDEEVRERLLDFVGRHFSNTGFGAKFTGYEGLDPDGVDVMARTALLLHPALRTVLEQARKDPKTRARTQTLDVIEANIAPNTAYMLSLAQGIRPHSIRNLRRFESFHDRAHMPDDRTFPMTGETRRRGTSRPINHLTGYDSLRRDLNSEVLRIAETVEREAREEDERAASEAQSDGGALVEADGEGGDDAS